VDLSVTDALTNHGIGSILAESAATTALRLNVGTLTNAGLMQAAGGLTATATGDFDNSGTVLTTATGNLDATAARFINSGTLQSAANMNLLTTNLTGTTLQNTGTMRANAMLAISASGLFDNAASALIFGGTLQVTANDVTNSGRIIATEGDTFQARQFINVIPDARFIGVTDTGAMRLEVTDMLVNHGAMHASDVFEILAGSIENTATGGISSSGDLSLSATNGSLVNRGALYAGGMLDLQATQNISNLYDATIDVDGDFTATATGTTSTFLNQGQINVGGNASISARNFQNVLLGAENLTRVWYEPGTINQHNPITGVSGDPAPNVSTDKWYYTGNNGYHGDWFDDRESRVYGFFYKKEQFLGIDDPSAQFGHLLKPQIAAANLTIEGFDDGKNVGGLLTATGTLSVAGRTSGSNFLNDAMILEIQKWNYEATWWYKYTLGSYDWNNPTGENHITAVSKSIQYATDYFDIGAGIYAANVNVSNVGTLENRGSTTGSTIDAITTAADSGVAADSIDAFSGTLLGGFTKGVFGGLKNLKTAKSGGIGAMSASTAVSASSGGAAFAAAGASGRNVIDLGGLQLKLPSNPNGFFVTSPDPRAKYLVSTNETFGVSGDAIGSDYLAEQFGLDPDQLEQRLGDPAYETYLVRQQLVDQLGTRLLAGANSEKEQMQQLMTDGAAEAKRLGFTFGAEPTPAQLAGLTKDMVWMVTEVVDGREVLVPRVYLAASTLAAWNSKGAVIGGENVSLDVGDLANTGGTISGSESLAIKATGDVRNTSGTITGGDVSIDAGGSIINETVTRGDQDNNLIGATASITATGDLGLKAGQDIVVKGANVKSGGDASIDAGGEIVVDTVEHRRVSTVGTPDNNTTTRTLTHHGSSLDIGGNATIKSGGDTTIAGSDVNVGGDLDLDAGGSVNLLARQDQVEVTTVTSKSGLGVGGGLWGSQTTTTNDFTGTNKGSTLNVGGNATIAAAENLVVEGSDVNIGGDADISATDIFVLDGKDERRTVTTVETTTFGIFSEAEGEAGAEANASGLGYSASASASASSKDGGAAEAGTEQGFGRLSANAGASAQASGSAGTTIGMRMTTETTDEYESKSRASTLNVGGNLKLNAKNDLVVRGSDIAAEGDVDLTAKNQHFLAGQDIKTVTTTSNTTTVGLNFGAEGSASASAAGQVGPGTASAGAEAQAEAEVSASIMVQNTKEHSVEGESTARVSTIKAGGNLTRTAENRIVDVGTDIEVGGDLTQSADTIESYAARNETWSSSESTTHTGKIGLYADASAEAKANTGGEAEASAGVSAGLKISYDYENSESSEHSSEAVVSNIKVGGSVKSTSTNQTILEGTTIEAGGDVTLEADSLDFRAAANTSTSSSSESNASATLKVGIGLSTDSGGAPAPEGSLEASGGRSTSGESSSEAVAGSIKSGGNLVVKTKQDARFEGTNLEAGGDAELTVGGNLTFDAARNTSSSSSEGFEVGGQIEASAGGIAGELEGSYENASSSSSEAVVGSLKSGGNLKVTAGGNATFEGTGLEAGGDASVEAGGNLTFAQATSTSSSDSFSAEAGFGAGSEKEEGKSSSSFEANASVGYSTESEKTAQTSTIKSGGNLSLKSGSDLTLQGAEVEAGGSADLTAGGDLRLTAKEESSSSFGVSAGFEASSSKSTEKGESTKSSGVGVEAALEGHTAVDRTGGTIKAGTGVNLNAGGDATLVGTQVQTEVGDVNVTAGGDVSLERAESYHVGGAIGVEVSSEKETKSGGNTAASSPAAGAAGAASGDKKPDDGKSGGLTDLGFTAGGSSQAASLEAGRGGNVNVRSQTTPPPARQ